MNDSESLPKPDATPEASTGGSMSTELATAKSSAISTILAPFRSLVWGYDQIASYLNDAVSRRLATVPDESVVPPNPAVAGPAIEALRFTAHEPTLRELYANLIATAMNATTTRSAHPSFVEILRQLTPDEARILGLFAIQDGYPLITLRAMRQQRDGYVEVLKNHSKLGTLAGCTCPDMTAVYLDNLSRLGLIDIPLGIYLTDKSAYAPLESEEHIKGYIAAFERDGYTITADRGVVRRTALGHQFIQACIATTNTEPQATQVA